MMKWFAFRQDYFKVQDFEVLIPDYKEQFVCINPEGTILVTQENYYFRSLRVLTLKYNNGVISPFQIGRIEVDKTRIITAAIKDNLIYLLTSEGDLLLYDIESTKVTTIGRFPFRSSKFSFRYDPKLFVTDQKIILLAKDYKLTYKLTVIECSKPLNVKSHIFESFPHSADVSGNYFYYKSESSIIRVSLDTLESEKFLECKSCTNFAVDDKTIVLFNGGNFNQSFSLDGTQIESNIDSVEVFMCQNIKLLQGNFVYFQEQDEKYLPRITYFMDGKEGEEPLDDEEFDDEPRVGFVTV
jgi:hypothetical protein